MSDLKWEYDENGVPKAIVMGGSFAEGRIEVTGIDRREASLIQGQFSRASKIADGAYTNFSQLRRNIDSEFTRIGVSGRVTDITVGALGNKYSTTNMEAPDVSKNAIDFQGQKYGIRVSLAGLDAQEALKLQHYLETHPQERAKFNNMLASVSENGSLTGAERSLVNNDTEQLMIRAGVTADVTSTTVAGLKPGK